MGTIKKKQIIADINIKDNVFFVKKDISFLKTNVLKTFGDALALTHNTVVESVHHNLWWDWEMFVWIVTVKMDLLTHVKGVKMDLIWINLEYAKIRNA